MCVVGVDPAPQGGGGETAEEVRRSATGEIGDALVLGTEGYEVTDWRGVATLDVGSQELAWEEMGRRMLTCEKAYSCRC